MWAMILIAMLGSLVQKNMQMMHNIACAMATAEKYGCMVYEVTTIGIIFGYLVRIFSAMRRKRSNAPGTSFDRALWQVHSNVTAVSAEVERVFYSYTPRLTGRHKIRRAHGGSPLRRGRHLKATMLAALIPVSVMTTTFVFSLSLDSDKRAKAKHKGRLQKRRLS